MLQGDVNIYFYYAFTIWMLFRITYKYVLKHSDTTRDAIIITAPCSLDIRCILHLKHTVLKKKKKSKNKVRLFIPYSIYCALYISFSNKYLSYPTLQN